MLTLLNADRYDADVTVDAGGAVAEMGASVASGVMEACNATYSHRHRNHNHYYFNNITIIIRVFLANNSVANHLLLQIDKVTIVIRPARMLWQNCFKKR